MKARLGSLFAILALALMAFAPAALAATTHANAEVTTDGGAGVSSTWTVTSWGATDAYSCETDGTTYAGSAVAGSFTVAHTYATATMATIHCTHATQLYDAFGQHLIGGGTAAGVSSFVGSVAANAWPIALALFTAMIGITLGVALFRYILGRGKGWVAGR